MIGRRALLAGLAVAPATAVTAMPAIDADAELLALGPQYDAARAAKDLVFARDDYDEWESDAALDVVNDIVGEIMTTPARTPAGLGLKARVVRDQMYLSNGWRRDEIAPKSMNGYDDLVLSLIEDLT